MLLSHKGNKCKRRIIFYRILTVIINLDTTSDDRVSNIKEMIRGFLFDVYPIDDKLVFWIKNKETKRIEIPWTVSLYVASTKSRLQRLETNPLIKPFVKKFNSVLKTEQVSDTKKSTVLQIITKKSSEILNLAKNIEKLDVFGKYRLYNVDIPSEQM